MRFPAARLTDLHTCPMCMGVPAPIVWKGAYTVLTGMLPQARVGDMCVCVGPPPPVGGDPIITGAWNVLVEGSPAARMTDLTAKAGTIMTGLPTVLIGTQGGGAGGGGGAGSAAPPAKSPHKFSAGAETGHEKPYKERYNSKGIQVQQPDTEKLSLKDQLKENAEVSAGYEHELFNKEKDFWESEGGHFKSGASAEAKLGISGDINGDLAAGAYANAKVAVITGKAEGKTLNGLAEGKVEGEALSASAEGGAGFRKSEDFTGVEGKIGGELVLVQGSAEGAINISPKTLYDNTLGPFLSWASGDPAKRTLDSAYDHGLRIGGRGEAGVGAAAGASAQLGKLDGVYGLTAEAKAGAGPMAGFKVFVGVY
jgi:uncharacterized Zn-binding protein involved in type VI secretion